MTRLLLASSLLLLIGCCPCDTGGTGHATCSPSGLMEVAPDGSIVTVTGPATLEDADTGATVTVPAGEVWRSTPGGWEVMP